MKPFLEGKRILEVFSKTNVDFPIHLHNAMELTLIIEGTATAAQDGKTHPLHSGDLFVSFPNQVHGYTDSDPALKSCIAIIPVVPHLSSFHRSIDQKVPIHPVLSQKDWNGTDFLTLMTQALADTKTASSQVMQGYILLIVGKLLPLLSLKDAPAESFSALQSVLLYLNEHFQEPMTRDSLADAVGYNRSYISHLFSDSLQTTLTDYLTTLRLDAAERMLLYSSVPVSQIAMSLGFGSIRSFNRVFQSSYGQSPSAFRRSSGSDS